MPTKNVLILGAGPAGLAIAARLKRAGISFDILEASAFVGNAWRNHYDRLKLHTARDLSHLPFVPFPRTYPEYVTRQQLVDYMDHYARQFELKPHFQTAAKHVERREDGSWRVTDQHGKDWTANHVVVATGANRRVFLPIYANKENFIGGKIIHSQAYRNPSSFAGQRVLIVGMGNTGAEIALDLANSDIPVDLSVRSPTNVVPLEFNGRPTQRTGILLRKFPNFIGDGLGKIVQRLTIGDLSAYGLKTPRLSPAAQLRRHGKTPVIDLGTVAAIRAGKIGVRPELERFTETGVRFVDGSAGDYDTVLFATGYRAALHELIDLPADALYPNGMPRFRSGEGALAGLHFLGFDTFANGILRSIRIDSGRILRNIQPAP